jgi:predicted nucleic acid-binding protein
MMVPTLVDTNVLVYRYDLRYPARQAIARDLLARGLREGSVRLPHQALVEFVSAASKRAPEGAPILSPLQARQEADEMLTVYPVLYPNDATMRTALRGAAAYQLSWFDAHLWAYAEHYGCGELWSEDFQHDRIIGTVRIVNPFR